MTISLVLLLAAFILFVLAACGVGARFNLQAAGLACWVLSALLNGTHILRTVAIVGLVLIISGCATDTGNTSKDRAGRVTNAVGEELFNSILAFGLGEGRAYLTGQNGQDAAAAAFQAASSGILSTGGIQRIVSAYAGPEVANVVAEKFAAVAPATPAQAAITSNIIGSALQTAANQLTE